MVANEKPGCWGVAARLPKKPGTQKLTPLSSAIAVTGARKAKTIAIAKKKRGSRFIPNRDIGAHQFSSGASHWTSFDDLPLRRLAQSRQDHDRKPFAQFQRTERESKFLFKHLRDVARKSWFVGFAFWVKREKCVRLRRGRFVRDLV